MKKLNRKRMDEYILNFAEKSPIARLFGMKLSFDQAGNAIVDLPYNPDLDHSQGGIHGGVYATLLDTAGWFAAAIVHDTDCWVATAELSFHLLEPVKQTSLRAVGRLLKAGKRQNVSEMFLYDAKGHLVGHATGTFIVLSNLSFLSVIGDTGEHTGVRS
ncbi:MAG: PaaI family thioesterase [Bacillota bacterium]